MTSRGRIRILSLLLGSALSLLWLITLPSASQTNGLPTGIIVPTPANTLIQPAVWTGRTAYRVGESARDFVFFSVNQPAYVYVLNIPASGAVQLLLPNQTQQDNFFRAGQYKLAQPFEMSRQAGTHFLQVLASPLPLALVKDFTELFPALGTNPDDVKKFVMAQIAARPLVNGEWGASWASYMTANAAPASADSFSQITVRAVEGDCRFGLETRDAFVYLDGSKTPSPAFVPLTVLRGDHTLHLEATGYRSQDLRVRTAAAPVQEVCANLQPTTFIRGKVFFTYSPAPRAYESVLFDASRSRAHLYEWDFGDGSLIATGEHVGHAYSFSGTFLVRLNVQYFDGESEVTVLPVQVRPSEACPASSTTLPACKGGTREADTLTLEAREARQVHLAWTQQTLTGTETRLRFDVIFDAFPPYAPPTQTSSSKTQTASMKIESYALVDLFDKSGVRLDSARVYTANTVVGGVGPVTGQPQTIEALLKNLFGASNLAKAGQIRVSVVLNVQGYPGLTGVRVRYRNLKIIP